MSQTLTLPNLDESLMHKLQLWAERHGRSVEAEATELLSRAVVAHDGEHTSTDATPHLPAPDPAAQERMKQGIEAVRGMWKGRGTTDEVMRELRGED